MTPEWTGERLEDSMLHESAIEHLHRYALAQELVSGKRVLDIACGTGYGSNLLAQKAESVDGVDIDETVIMKAAVRYKQKNLVFTKGSVEKIPFDNSSFDVVVSFETLEHITEHDSMMAEMKRVLKPGGILIISTPDKLNYSDLNEYSNPFHKKELYESEFKTLLGKYFRHQSYYIQNIHTSSIITNNLPGPLALYDGGFYGIEKLNAPVPLYFVAICSDEEVLIPSNSLFLGISILDEALQKKEKEIKNSLSYRLGNGILYPAKRLRKLFRKSSK